MTIEQAYVSLILVAALYLFAAGRWRYDAIAMAAMLAVVLPGIVDADEALRSFGHPAVVTVAAVLVISRALRNSGIVDLLARYLMPYTHSLVMHIGVLTGLVTLASAFMNNVGALALMLPVTLATAHRRNRSPALLLMPLAFGSILGGLITLIGTPPNIIISAYRNERIGEPFTMFDFTPVGGVIAVISVLFIALFGWRLIPSDRHSKLPKHLGINDYIMELRVKGDSKLVGAKLNQIEQLSNEEVLPVGMIRSKDTFIHPAPWRLLRTGDLIIVRADPASLKSLIDTTGLELVASKATALKGLKVEDLRLAEATVTPGSVLEGRNTRFIRRRSGRSLSLIAMARQGQAIRTRLRDQHFQAGDVLLFQGDAETIDATLSSLGLLPLAERDLTLAQPLRVRKALAVFAIALALIVSGWVPVTIAFILAIGAYVVLDILPMRDLYRDIEWPVIVLLAAMIPLGLALDRTGTTTLVATTVTSLTGALSPVGILTLVMILTIAMSSIVNNAATALIMAPISAGIATEVGASIDPFLMSVAIGSSCAFLTPIGHQSNTLVMGPGGYRFGDYWRLGLPLEILIVALSIPLIVWVWPL